MTPELEQRLTHALLEAARTRADQAGLSYAGGRSPHDAWAPVKAGDAAPSDPT
ncbi:hypothetical protein [Paraburkholderia lacunae]|uniref:hypothetical protein n=1 Tax=Paraburkholderia lacunae TaxID=2211104 RepID=UPI001AD7E8FB